MFLLKSMTKLEDLTVSYFGQTQYKTSDEAKNRKVKFLDEIQTKV
jgi:hypothetical protein